MADSLHPSRGYFFFSDSRITRQTSAYDMPSLVDDLPKRVILRVGLAFPTCCNLTIWTPIWTAVVP